MASDATPAPSPPTLGHNNIVLALSAVLMGAFISTLTGRLSSFGLADIRGAVHAGFDEGAWITTAQTVGQMLVLPLAVWGGNAFGPRRVLVWGAALFTVASLLLPFSTSLRPLLLLQFLAGIGSGTFVPLTLSVIVRSLAPRLWPYGIAVYALNLELSLNISASLEAWYVDNWDWRFIFWQNVPLGIAMLACLHFGFKRVPLPEKVPRPSLFGVVMVGIGLALVYAGLDQGNRLDWFNSGVIVGLFGAGGLLLLVALALTMVRPSSWFDLREAVRWPLPLLLVNIGILRLSILSTAFLIPQYLVAVRGFRSLEIGEALIWVVLPQLVTAPLAAWLLIRFDSRWVAGAGLVAVATSCFVVATSITAAWGPQQFLSTQLLQALGQSLALSGVVYIGIVHMRPAAALTFGAMLQSARVLGGEAGLAFTATLVRTVEQRASNILGQHIAAGDTAVTSELGRYANAVAGHTPVGEIQARAVALLARSVRQAADLQSVITGFETIGLVAILALGVLIMLGPSPANPALTRKPAR